MRSRKIIFIFFIISTITVSTLIFNGLTSTDNKDINNSLFSLSDNANQLGVDDYKKESFSEEHEETKNSYNKMSIGDEKKTNKSNNTLSSKPIENTGFSSKIIELSEKRLENISTFLTKDDLPDELKPEFEKTLISYKSKGYVEADENYSEYMYTLYNYLTPVDLTSPNIIVELQDIDSTLLSDYQYLGEIVPQGGEFVEKGKPITAVRRLFKHEEGYISLYEEDITSSKLLLQKEFVNEEINGYPATYIKYCPPSDRCATKLTWLTKGKKYELTFSGKEESLGKEKLISIAESFNFSEKNNSDSSR